MCVCVCVCMYLALSPLSSSSMLATSTSKPNMCLHFFCLYFSLHCSVASVVIRHSFIMCLSCVSTRYNQHRQRSSVMYRIAIYNIKLETFVKYVFLSHAMTMTTMNGCEKKFNKIISQRCSAIGIYKYSIWLILIVNICVCDACALSLSPLVIMCGADTCVKGVRRAWAVYSLIDLRAYFFLCSVMFLVCDVFCGGRRRFAGRIDWPMCGNVWSGESTRCQEGKKMCDKAQKHYSCEGRKLFGSGHGRGLQHLCLARRWYPNSTGSVGFHRILREILPNCTPVHSENVQNVPLFKKRMIKKTQSTVIQKKEV